MEEIAVNKFIQICMVSCLMHASTMVFAGSMRSEIPQQAGFFLGLGGSYNSVKFKQDYSAKGIADVIDDSNGAIVATGEAGGPAAPFSKTQTTFAPEVQAGYYSYCRGTCNFWGIKYLYQYLDITSIDKLIDTPQAGFLDPVGGTPLRFTGNVITESAQTRINHEMALLAFIGHSLGKSKIYLGIGPSVFRTKSNIFQAFGFANLDGLPREATGEPVSFSNSKWVWGGAIQMGLSCILDPCWALDFNYTYTITKKYRNNFSAPFRTSLIGGYTDIGTLFIETKRQIRAQAFNVTINKGF